MLGKYTRPQNEQFDQLAISNYFGFPTDNHIVLTPFGGRVQYFDAAEQKLVAPNQLPERLKQLSESNLLDANSLRPNRTFMPNVERPKFTTPAHFQLDENGVWFARGGKDHHTVERRTKYWISLFRKDEQEAFASYNKHRWTPTIVTLSRDGGSAASADLFGHIHVWNTKTTKPIRIIRRSLFNRVYAVRWASDSTVQFGTEHHAPASFATNRMGPLTHRFALTSRRIETLDSPLSPPSYFRPRDGLDLRLTREVAGVKQNHRVLRLSRNDERKHFARPVHGEISSFQFLEKVPGCTLPVAVGFDKGQLLIVDFDDERVVAILAGHESVVSGIEQSPNGQLLASSSADGTIRFWDVSKLRPAPDIDLYTYGRGNTVLKAGSVAIESGARVGDRILKVNGISYYASRQKIVDRIYTLGQDLSVEIERQEGEVRTRKTLTIPTTNQTAIVQPLLSFLMTKKGEWILWSPKGYYDSSVEGDEYVRWHRNVNRSTPAISDSLSAYANLMRRSDIIDELLATRDVQRAMANAGDLKSPLENLHAIPKPVLKLEEQLPNETDDTTLPVRFNLAINGKNEQAIPIVMRMKRNGRVMSEWTRKQVTIPAGRENTVIDIKLGLHQGRNAFEVVAWSEDEVESVPLQFSVNCTADSGVRKPKLVVLSIGVSEYIDDKILDLDYADDDALAIREALIRQKKGNQYSDVVSYSESLTNANATARNIRLGLDWFSANMTELDYGFVFFAGHGLKLRGDYYLLPHDYVNGKPSTAIDFEYFSKQLQKCPGRILVALDACRSGAAIQKTRDGNRDIEQAARILTSRKNGLITMMSCQPFEESVEDSKWKHGAFGLALEEALLDCKLIPKRDSGVVDINKKNQKITVNEIRSYITDRVNELTEGRQKPAVWPKLIDSELNFTVAEVISED